MRWLLIVLLGLLGTTDQAKGYESLAVESKALRAASELLPSRFTKLETTRFVILTDADTNWTREQGARLEAAYRQFQRFTKRMKLSPRPLRHKLVCVLFDRRHDYLQFAKHQDEAGASWIAGYYSPNSDRIVFYNLQEDDGILQAHQKLEEMHREARSMERDAGRALQIGLRKQAEELNESAREYRRHLDREQTRLENYTRDLSAATTVHEAFHQLMFHTGLQATHIEYPVWFSEGLATAFETGNTNLPFGPDFEFEQRRAEYFKILGAGEQLPLRRLVKITSLSRADESEVRLVYHQSYALVTWLSRYRQEELRKYLEHMKLLPPGAASPNKHLAYFNRCFGDVDKLERAWLKHEYHQFAEYQASQLASAPVESIR